MADPPDPYTQWLARLDLDPPQQVYPFDWDVISPCGLGMTGVQVYYEPTHCPSCGGFGCEMCGGSGAWRDYEYINPPKPTPEPAPPDALDDILRCLRDAGDDGRILQVCFGSWDGPYDDPGIVPPGSQGTIFSLAKARPMFVGWEIDDARACYEVIVWTAKTVVRTAPHGYGGSILVAVPRDPFG